MAPACGGILPWKNVSNCWQMHSSQEEQPSSTCLQRSEELFRPQGERSREGGMTTFLGGKYDIQLEKENNPSTVESPIYLWAATVAAASKANCLITLSSRYFCSHLVMSASRARILSSFSRSSSMSAVALYSDTLAAWDVPWRWFPRGKNQTKQKQKSQDAAVRLRVGWFAFCHWFDTRTPPEGNAVALRCVGQTNEKIPEMENTPPKAFFPCAKPQRCIPELDCAIQGWRAQPFRNAWSSTDWLPSVQQGTDQYHPFKRNTS